MENIYRGNLMQEVGLAFSKNSDPSISLDTTKLLSTQVAWTGSTPTAVVVPSASISAVTNTFTSAAHGLDLGLVGQFTTDDTLPSGLSLSTNYFIIPVDVDHFKVASSLANAKAGTAVALIDAGVGNQTFTPTTLSASLQFQKSIDGVNWASEGSSITLSSGAHVDSSVSQVDVAFQWLRAKVTVAAGQVDLTALLYLKG